MFAVPRNAWCRLGLLLPLLLLWDLGVSDAVDADCNFRQDLEPGRTYYISSPNYPNSYPRSKSCQWYAVSNTRVKLTCSELNIATSQNCAADSLTVYTSRQSSPYTFCGTRGFTLESEGNEMFVILTTAYNTPGGSFRCQVEATRGEDCNCGWKNPSRIIGGVETGVNEYPMMAGIINAVSKKVFCGGTIISTKHILTAAHCLYLNPNQMGVLVGDHDLTTGADTGATKLHPVQSYVRHPYFETTEKGYDVGIITIATTIIYTNAVGPACLPFRHYQDTFVGSYVEELGWGLTEFVGAPSNTLQKVRLGVVDYSTCRKYYPVLNSGQMCTYAEGRDSCQFDSGGPVLWQNPSTRRLTLAGIISYGKYCARKEPGISTRVGAFLDWIIDNTRGAQFCQLE